MVNPGYDDVLMNFEQFSTNWFVLYSLAVGFLAVAGGLALILKKKNAASYLTDAASDENPPILLVRILKYFLLFSLPGLVLAFVPFSWIELLFTFWCLLLIFIAGIRLVRWEESRTVIKAHADNLPVIIRRSGAIMVSVGLAIFLLAYFIIQRTSI